MKMKVVSNRSDSKKRRRDDPQDSIVESPKKAKVHAQRKFAQGAAYNSPSITVIKDKVRPPANVNNAGLVLSAKRPNTEDFLTFLCFRRTSILPPKLDFFKDACKQQSVPANCVSKVSNSTSAQKNSTPEVVMKQSSKKNEKNEAFKKIQTPVQALRRKYQEQRLAKQNPTNVTKLAQKVKGKNMMRTRSSTLQEEKPKPVENTTSLKERKPQLSGLRSGLQRTPPDLPRHPKKTEISSELKNLRSRVKGKPMVKTIKVKTTPEKKSVKNSPKEVTAKKMEPAKNLKSQESTCKAKDVKVNVKKFEGLSDFSSDDNEPLLAVKKGKTVVKGKTLANGVKESLRSNAVKTRSQATEVFSPIVQVTIRPTRKTKEAAAIYMEMITKKLVSPEKSGDDDRSSVDSFPELPNVKRSEQRESEIKAKAMAMKRNGVSENRLNSDTEDKDQGSRSNSQRKKESQRKSEAVLRSDPAKKSTTQSKKSGKVELPSRIARDLSKRTSDMKKTDNTKKVTKEEPPRKILREDTRSRGNKEENLRRPSRDDPGRKLAKEEMPRKEDVFKKENQLKKTSKDEASKKGTKDEKKIVTEDLCKRNVEDSSRKVLRDDTRRMPKEEVNKKALPDDVSKKAAKEEQSRKSMKNEIGKLDDFSKKQSKDEPLKECLRDDAAAVKSAHKDPTKSALRSDATCKSAFDDTTKKLVKDESAKKLTKEELTKGIEDVAKRTIKEESPKIADLTAKKTSQEEPIEESDRIKKMDEENHLGKEFCEHLTLRNTKDATLEKDFAENMGAESLCKKKPEEDKETLKKQVEDETEPKEMKKTEQSTSEVLTPERAKSSEPQTQPAKEALSIPQEQEPSEKNAEARVTSKEPKKTVSEDIQKIPEEPDAATINEKKVPTELCSAKKVEEEDAQKKIERDGEEEKRLPKSDGQKSGDENEVRLFTRGRKQEEAEQKSKKAPERTSTTKKPKGASAGSSAPCNSWLPPAGTAGSNLVEAPTFYPTEKEFQDPLEFFEKIRPAAESFGLCRIVPPSTFKPDCKVSDDMRFTAYNQYVHRIFHRWGPNIREMMAIKKYLATQSISLKQPPWIGGIEVDLPRLYQSVQNCGGLMKVMEKKKWNQVADMMRIPKAAQDRVTKLDDIYCKYLLPYDTLSHDERQKLFDEVESDWMKRQESTNDEEDSEEESYIDECEECIVKGRNMALNQFYRIARNTMSMWFKTQEPAPSEVENEFWRHVSERTNHVCVHSGSIDSSGWGYGFPVAKNNSFSRHPWNLKVLTNNSGSVLRSLGPVMGVTVPTLHVGMVFTAFCWYRDPHGLPWVEYLHTGAPKIWYGISDDNSAVFKEALTKLLPRYIKNKKIWLPCDTAMVPPALLVEEGVSLCHTVQKPGQFILVFPRAFTSSICTGYLVSESVYFAQPSWLTTAEQVFRDIQDCCEPTMFSLERLVFSIATDSRSSVEVLKQVLPMVWHIKQNEIDSRKTLFNLGLKASERLPIRDQGGSKKRKGRLVQDEEGDYECEVCRTNLCVSLVINSQEEGVLCLPHAIDLLTQKRHHLKYCKLMYSYTQEELAELVEKLEQRIESKSQRKVQSKSSLKTS